MPRLKLRLAEANFHKAHQNALLLATQALHLSEELTKALITLREAQQQQAATMGEPEQHQAASLLNEQTTTRISFLNKALAYKERCFATCNAMLQAAKATLVEAQALLPPAIVQSTRNPLNDDKQTPPPLTNGTFCCGEGIAPPLLTLDSYYISAVQTLWAPKTANPKETILLQVVLTSPPAAPSP